MSKVLRVAGYKCSAESHRKKVVAWYACIDAGVTTPAELGEFFEDGETPTADGIDVSGAVTPDNVYSEAKDATIEAVDIDLSELPAGVTHVRVWIQW